MTMENYLGKDFYMYYPWLSLNYEPIKQLKMSFLIVDGENLFIGKTQYGKGDYYKYETTLNIRPAIFFDLEFKHRYHETAGKYIARTYEAKAKLQFHKNFWFRAIVQVTNSDICADDEKDNRFNIYPLFTYKPSANASIYLGASDTDSEGNEFYWDHEIIDWNNYVYDQKNMTYFLKISYTFDVM